MKRLSIVLTILVLISCNSKRSTNELANETSGSSALFVDFQKPEGRNFSVSGVIMADSLLKVDTAKNIFENKIEKEVLFFPEEFKTYGLVNCPNNGLIQTIQECYDNHRPLILTPDVIWLAICQGVSIHINENYDSLKNSIFIGDKPDKIVVRNDSLEYNVKHWQNLISSFSNETKKYTNDDYYSFFVPEFSTTQKVNTVAYQITLLESYKKAFAYVAQSGCGIPSITITGEKQDWQAIYSKLDKLNGLGLSNWSENLKPIISEFINVIDGNVNVDFWQSIYKNASEYNAFYISGWIIKLFPYIKEKNFNTGVYDEKTDVTRLDEVYKPNEFLDGNRYLISTLSTDNFPSGVAKIEISWENLIKSYTKEMEVYAGFLAIRQYSDKTLEPFISWVVCEKDAKKPNHKLMRNKNMVLKHAYDYWSPSICKKPIEPAIYDIKRFKTQKESILHIESILQDSLFKSSNYKWINFSSDSVEFIVFSNGTIGEISLMGENRSKQLTEYIRKQLIELPEKWFPATAHPMDVMDDSFSDEENKILIKVNSKVKMKLIKD